MWDIPQGVLKFAINAGVNTLPSLDNLKRWGKRVSDRCSFCGNIETLAHVLSNCSTALTQGRYTWRHNSVLSSFINFIRPHMKDGMVLFSDMPGFQAPHGGTVPPHILVTSLKPDIFVFHERSLEVFVFELTCPWDTNIERSHNFKLEKYAPLVADLSRTHIVHFYAIEVSARGQVSKENCSRLKSFLFKVCSDPKNLFKPSVGIASKAALLSSFSIFAARREPTWEDPPPLILRWDLVLSRSFFYRFIILVMTRNSMICIRLCLPFTAYNQPGNLLRLALLISFVFSWNTIFSLSMSHDFVELHTPSISWFSSI